MINDKKVSRKTLSNGLTVLVRSNHRVPKVSAQLWYNVGSKDEKSGEKGIAHLIEHMIFKGTSKLSESDINMITQKLSGYCNAFTSHDYTGYLFDFPKQHWGYALEIMADCMRGCTFKKELLNSELKAVIQELKMYKDNYSSTLVEELLSVIFTDHPYHYPIIGYKQDLWNLERDALVAFYEKHYVPNNATLIVVGDVEPEQVFEQAEKYFGAISSNPDYKKATFYQGRDLIAKKITIKRDVQNPFVVCAWRVPGASSGKEYILEVLSTLLGGTKSSRLHNLIVDQKALASDLETFYYDLFDGGVLFVYFQPKSMKHVVEIKQIIHAQIDDLIENGIPHDELQRAKKKAQTAHLALFESNQKQAYAMGKSFLATGDDQGLFTYEEQLTREDLSKDMVALLKNNFASCVMHEGVVEPLKDAERDQWKQVQDLSDTEDARVLSGKVRELPVEPAQYVHSVSIKPSVQFSFPKNELHETFSNGLKVLLYRNDSVPTVSLILDFKAQQYFEPQEQSGIYSFLSEMLVEGTQAHPDAQFAKELESYGISLFVRPGSISLSMLAEDFKKGCELLVEVLTQATLSEEAIERVRERILIELKNYWDNPNSFVWQLAREVVYKDHPYGRNFVGTVESIKKISRQNLVDFYKKYITPVGARLAVVGAIDEQNASTVLSETVGSWQGRAVESLAFPELSKTDSREVSYKINRDQVVLCFAGLSVPRMHSDYDKVLLFDQIFGGGVLGSMSSRLFQLREQSGLFYTIGGSLLSGADQEPGMIVIRTIVSLDRLQEAEEKIKGEIETALESITETELEEAKRAIVNAMVDTFETNVGTVSALLFVDKYDLDKDYFDKRAEQVSDISLDQVREAVRKILHTDSLATIRIGRM